MQNVAILLPDVGTTFDYINQNFRVTGWMKRNDDGSFVWCKRSEGDFLSGQNDTRACVISVFDMKVTGKVIMTSHQYAYALLVAHKLIGKRYVPTTVNRTNPYN